MTGGPGAAKAPARVAARALNCPSCGAALEVRGFDHSLNVVCGSCLSVLDAKDPGLRVLQQFSQRMRVAPHIPLGTRGQWRGAPYEAIGFQQRTIVVDGTAYSWREYLLFNPYRGFRYLTEYENHWNDVTTVRSIPPEGRSGGRPVAELGGTTFRHFQTADAETTFVAGEFPWQVRVGDRAIVRDFIAPPVMLSAEMTGDETTWSLGRYVQGAEVWRAFKLPGEPWPPVGVFANQPSPYSGAARGLWSMFLFFLVAVFAVGLWRAASRPDVALRERHVLSLGSADPYVTPTFRLGGRTSNVEVGIDTDIDNGWAYFSLALVNEVAGTAVDFGREVSYYHGVDQGESWSEGSRRDRVRIPSVPPGEYYLRVDPELAPEVSRPVTYTITLRRDVPAWSYFGIALLLLALPPVFSGSRTAAFEARRWAESDYPPSSGGDDDD